MLRVQIFLSTFTPSITEHITFFTVAVQEALLLTMLRLAAVCQDGLPDDITQNVTGLQRLSGRHIRVVGDLKVFILHLAYS